MVKREFGAVFAVLAAVAFGMSGPFAKALTDTGWTPEAVALARIAGGAVILVPIVLVARRGALWALRDAPRTVALYGVVAVAGIQVAFFNAIQHLSVGVALMLEYLSPILVIVWFWLRTRRRPAAATLIGVAVALLGAAIVLDLAGGAALDPIGLAWGLTAAVCSAVYFLVSAGDGGQHLDPLVLSASGLTVGAAVVAALGLVGFLPMHANSADIVVAGSTQPWWVAVLALGLVSTAIAYVLGIVGSRSLGAGPASIVALFEVVCAVAASWVLLGQEITPIQMIGGAILLGGVALAQVRTRGTAHTTVVASPTATVDERMAEQRLL